MTISTSDVQQCPRDHDWCGCQLRQSPQALLFPLMDSIYFKPTYQHMTDEMTIEVEQEEEPELLPIPKYDPLPDNIDDLDSWLSAYKLRLHHAILNGRNKARDKSVLKTLAYTMEQQGTEVFDASVRWLVIHSGMYDQAVQKALISLRAEGYIKRHMVRGVIDSEFAKDGRRAVYSYSLVMDALPPTPEGAVIPNTKLTKLVEGDFEDAAFGGRQGFRARRCDIYLWCRQNPGATVYAVHKALQMSFNTAKSNTEWLRANNLIRVKDDGKIIALEGGIQSRTLEAIVDRNWLQEKTARRVEHAEKGWEGVMAGRRAKRKAVRAPSKDTEDIETRITKEEELDFRVETNVNSQEPSVPLALLPCVVPTQ